MIECCVGGLCLRGWRCVISRDYPYGNLCHLFLAMVRILAIAISIVNAVVNKNVPMFIFS